jgi:hypothetical protein
MGDFFYFPPQGTVLQGVPVDTLRQWLTQAQSALQTLMIGGNIIGAGYGDKNITYTPADIPALTQWIHLLQRQLNLVPPRRAIRPYFK